MEDPNKNRLIVKSYLAAILSLIVACGPKDKNKSSHMINQANPLESTGVGVTAAGGGSESPAAPNLSSINSGQSPAPVGLGTTDGVGGNGIDGKLYEDYIFHPEKEAAFVSVLRPKMKALAKVLNLLSSPDKALDLSKLNEVLINSLWRMKTWYLIPSGLKVLPNEAVGAGFLSQDQEQYALQDKFGVWIDKKAYNKMDERAQARSLLHEWVASLYILKRVYTQKEICRYVMGVFAGIPTLRDQMGIDKASCIEAPDVPLSENGPKLIPDDYAHIRAVTNHIFNLDENENPETFKAFLQKNQLWAEEASDTSEDNFFLSKWFRHTDKKITSKSFVDMMATAKREEELSGKCYDIVDSDLPEGSQNIIEDVCRLEFEKFSGTSQFYKLSATNSVGEVVISSSAFLDGGQLIYSNNLPISKSGVYVYRDVATHSLTREQSSTPGTEVSQLSFLFTSKMRFLGVIHFSSQISRITTKEISLNGGEFRQAPYLNLETPKQLNRRWVTTFFAAKSIELKDLDQELREALLSLRKNGVYSPFVMDISDGSNQNSGGRKRESAK